MKTKICKDTGRLWGVEVKVFDHPRDINKWLKEQGDIVVINVCFDNRNNETILYYAGWVD